MYAFHLTKWSSEMSYSKTGKKTKKQKKNSESEKNPLGHFLKN